MRQEALPPSVVLRKEVIQPHLPIRLPCYDFIPITCLLYTSDAADDLLCVDLGGRRILTKKKKNNNHN